MARAQLLRTVITGLVLALGAVATPAASAAQVPVWAAATAQPLPGNAATAAGTQNAAYNSVSCASAGNCTAGGYYSDMNGTTDQQALAATETGGTWGAPFELVLPGGATTAAGAQNAGINTVSCTSAGNCVAVGYYNDTNGSKDAQAMTATETGRIWGQATELSLPTGAATTAGAQNAGLYSVTCTSAGNCVAGGYYLDTSGSQQAMTATETSGVWAQATELALPGNAAGAQNAALYSVACSSAGNCAASGYYTDTNGAGDHQAMAATETSGTWAAATEIALPSGATTVAGQQDASLRSVSCTSSQNCVAVGHYTTGSFNYQALTATETNGVWAQATHALLPSNAKAAGQGANLDSVTCTSPGNCIAAGDYSDTNGANDNQAMTAIETSGSLYQASELTLPSGANTTAGGQNAALRSVICTSVGTCVAVGHYADGNGNQQPMLVTSTPTNAAPTLALTTTSLPAGVVGTAYSAQLRSTGGAGTNTWSLSTGSLPAGLTLNTATGAITGTPTTAGTKSFTAAVSNPGPPPQTATAALSIAVSPASSTTTTTTGTSTTTTTVDGNQQITVTTTAGSACTANTKALSVTFRSTTVLKSKGTKLRFSKVAFFIDKGVKHVKHKFVRTKAGKKKKVKVTFYVANATARKAPVTVRLSLRGLKSGTHKLTIVAYYKKTIRKNGHAKTVTVTKKVITTFKVC